MPLSGKKLPQNLHNLAAYLHINAVAILPASVIMKLKVF